MKESERIFQCKVNGAVKKNPKKIWKILKKNQEYVTRDPDARHYNFRWVSDPVYNQLHPDLQFITPVGEFWKTFLRYSDSFNYLPRPTLPTVVGWQSANLATENECNQTKI